MSNKSRFVEVAERINSMFAAVANDPILPAGMNPQWVVSKVVNTRYLPYAVPSSRRGADPLTFDTSASECPCDFATKYSPLDLPPFSQVILLPDRHKAHQNAVECGPEPREEHYADLLELASRLPGSLTVLNLPGSGASGPQHFHTQIFPLAIQSEAGPQPNAMAELLKNLHIADTPQFVGQVEIREIDYPVWGCQLKLAPSHFPCRIGIWLHRVIHRRLRYAS